MCFYNLLLSLGYNEESFKKNENKNNRMSRSFCEKKYVFDVNTLILNHLNQ